jgi:hypothetical protein
MPNDWRAVSPINHVCLRIMHGSDPVGFPTRPSALVNQLARRHLSLPLLFALCVPGTSWAQSRSIRQGAPQALCRAPEALDVFSMTVRHVLKAQLPSFAWPVFQLPCDTVSGVSDASQTAILVVDRAFANDQDVLKYGFAPFPFAASPSTIVERQPDDPFARLGRLILKPTLTTVPSLWTRGELGADRTDALMLAAAAGAVQAVAGLKDAPCAAGSANVPEQLLAAAEERSRHRLDYHVYFEAALEEQRAVRGQSAARGRLGSLAQSVADALGAVAVPGLRCDLGNRDRFSLMPSGVGATTLARTAEHIEAAVAGVRRSGRSDLGQLNLARACALQAVTEMIRNSRPPTCQAADYGLWTRAYVPLLHAAQVKVLETSR